MRLIEQVHHIRKTLPSTGETERQAVREGSAAPDVVERTFPSLPGSHLALTDPVRARGVAPGGACVRPAPAARHR